MGDKNTKQKLFETMEKLNPEFNLQEITPVAPPNQTTPTDVVNMEKATSRSSQVQYANSRIDTPQEFQQGFAAWLGTTGFNPQNKPLSISQAQTLVRNAMLALGYK